MKSALQIALAVVAFAVIAALVIYSEPQPLTCTSYLPCRGVR